MPDVVLASMIGCLAFTACLAGLGNDGGFCLSANATTTADQQLCDTREATFGMVPFTVHDGSLDVRICVYERKGKEPGAWVSFCMRPHVAEPLLTCC